MAIAEREIMATNGARDLWFKMMDWYALARGNYSITLDEIALRMYKTESELTPAMDYLVQNGFVSRTEKTISAFPGLPYFVYSVIRFK